MKKPLKDATVLAGLAMVLIAVLDLYALSRGIDGTMLLASGAAIAGLAAGAGAFKLGKG